MTPSTLPHCLQTNIQTPTNRLTWFSNLSLSTPPFLHSLQHTVADWSLQQLLDPYCAMLLPTWMRNAFPRNTHLEKPILSSMYNLRPWDYMPIFQGVSRDMSFQRSSWYRCISITDLRRLRLFFLLVLHHCFSSTFQKKGNSMPQSYTMHWSKVQKLLGLN